jgi:hypothetical protein
MIVRPVWSAGDTSFAYLAGPIREHARTIKL